MKFGWRDSPINANRQEHSRPYRFFFYSFDCNEPAHIHVQRERMVCKYWLRPVALAGNDGFSARELSLIRKEAARNLSKILEAWNEHCY